MELDGRTVLVTEAGCGIGRALACEFARQVQELVARTLDALGRIDVLFNNAGSFSALGGLVAGCDRQPGRPHAHQPGGVSAHGAAR